ncbi:DUF4148 domain-containing protein [Piscinibacter koreensis]|uniref:DUF4148 domain-containing protein n=1 Tax=Piscinibacter koreensis TaxID=2742824 RepID=A0A7Y6NMY5_9BURK|nr:DUF4148 domain-containing protein [Schlegelella koreensis]NUZ06037.1 DUF4148 domain-containing protein [Schlegelella koreensis]
MKSNKTLLAATAIALLNGASLANAGTYSLAPAGQGPIDNPVAQTSSVSREQVRSQIAQARVRGELIPAGQGPVGNLRSSASVLARADVKTQTLQARNAGALVPAGEGPVDAITATYHRANAPVAD